MEQKIYNLIRKIWQDEQMPKDWEEGIIYPIYKKGDRSVSSNCRGITLLNVTYKIFTSVLHDRLQKITEKKNWRLPGGIQDKQIYDRSYTYITTNNGKGL